MKKWKIALSISAASALILVGCEKFLDVQPRYVQDAENYFNQPSDYEMALTAAYDLLQTSYLTQWIGEIASDNAIAGGESVTDTEGLHQIENMMHNAVNNELRSVFRWNYAGIARVNYLMEFKDKIDFVGKEQIIGQARFLRAYYYFELVKYFGEVPLVIDQRLGADQVTKLDRSPTAEVYAQIEADLQYASATLPWSNPEKGRVDKGAALALLGKVHLYQNDFSVAAVILDSVIDFGGYALVEDYDALWLDANENNSETVFDIEYSGLEGGSYGCFVCLEGNAAAGFNGIRQYEGPLYGDGNSYNLPTADLYQAFDISDIRRDITILDLDAFIASQPNPSSISYAQGGGGHTGYYNNKYIKRQGEIGLPDNDLTSPLNYKVIRYADVLLMAAEALAHTGQGGKALGFLNEVRARVNMPAMTSSGNALMEDIYMERRLELSGEGLRFWDLVRTGKAPSTISNFVSGKHERFPLPQVEIDLAGGTWNQNPGY
jgi:starch-binding outer membrane protein, SusD/RagB family